MLGRAIYDNDNDDGLFDSHYTINSVMCIYRDGAKTRVWGRVVGIEIHRIEMTALSQRTAPGVQSRRVPL